MLPDLHATMVTTTTYGTWLPGDINGYVQKGIVLPSNPALLNHAKQMMLKSPVFLTSDQQSAAFEAMLAACDEFKYAFFTSASNHGTHAGLLNTDSIRLRRWWGG